LPLVAEYAAAFGRWSIISVLYLPNALGSTESTVLRMTAGYAVFPNGGKIEVGAADTHRFAFRTLTARPAIVATTARCGVGCDARFMAAPGRTQRRRTTRPQSSIR
jgi:hypothetical protein